MDTAALEIEFLEKLLENEGLQNQLEYSCHS